MGDNAVAGRQAIEAAAAEIEDLIALTYGNNDTATAKMMFREHLAGVILRHLYPILRADLAASAAPTELDLAPNVVATLVHVITAHNVDGVQKECIVTTSLPLAMEIRDALKGIWKNGVNLSSRTIDEIPRNVIAEIDVMHNPPKSKGYIGGGRHG